MGLSLSLPVPSGAEKGVRFSFREQHTTVLTVGGCVSSATLAVLLGLHSEVFANEEAIAMLHQPILLCSAIKHRLHGVRKLSWSYFWGWTRWLFTHGRGAELCMLEKNCSWLLVSQDTHTRDKRCRQFCFSCDESAVPQLSDRADYRQRSHHSVTLCQSWKDDNSLALKIKCHTARCELVVLGLSTNRESRTLLISKLLCLYYTLLWT